MHTVFGKIDSNSVEEYYGGEIEIDGKIIEIDLNFESGSVRASLLDNIERFISNIPKFAQKAWDAIADDWDLDSKSETARFYLQHHLDEFSENEIIKLFGTSNIEKSEFLRALSLVRIGLYPEDDEIFSVFDIQFSREFTNYIMSVSIDADSFVTSISMES